MSVWSVEWKVEACAFPFPPSTLAGVQVGKVFQETVVLQGWCEADVFFFCARVAQA